MRGVQSVLPLGGDSSWAASVLYFPPPARPAPGCCRLAGQQSRETGAQATRSPGPPPRPCSRPPSVPGRKPRPSGRRGEAPPTAKSRPRPAKGAGGVRHWPLSGGMLQLRRSAHRKNTREQRFASCSGLGGTVRDTGRSWRRQRGCWRPGRLAGPLGGSPRTTCFWEGCAHGPPVPASRGRLGGVRYARAAASAAGRRVRGGGICLEPQGGTRRGARAVDGDG